MKKSFKIQFVVCYLDLLSLLGRLVLEVELILRVLISNEGIVSEESKS